MSTSQGTSERILSVVEAAKILRLSKSKTYELIHDNQLPHVRLGGRYIVPEKDTYPHVVSDMQEGATRAVNKLLDQL